ncbi:hypothetical protein [Jiangella anatolica]|uniref:Uncharacterized protein n=1 Tax=Jiangella anatolica TaxID=2670374 RepID=A0A2W2BDU6_9ACTN|nr:hypothetical protein [Jiangella anatolica]PZF84152.1 hypothetical protein C1I92_09895 [Jiangella anatolica]
MRFYSSIASEATIQGGVDGGATTITVAGATGYPASTPFTAVLDPDTSTEEIVTVTNRAGGLWTIQRAQDGTAALPHENGAKVRHMATARDFREPQEHIDASTGVHGVTSGNVVGTSQAQTLTNKTISGTSNTLTNIAQSSVTNLTTDLAALDSTLDGHIAATAAHGATGAVVGTTNAQTLSNKTIAGASNTLQVRQQDLTDAYYILCAQTADANIAASTKTRVSYTTQDSRGTWASDGHSSRRIVPVTGRYRIRMWGQFKAGGISASNRIYIHDAPADGTSEGTMLRQGNIQTSTTGATGADIGITVTVNAGRAICFFFENNFASSVWGTDGGLAFSGYSVEYLGPA